MQEVTGSSPAVSTRNAPRRRCAGGRSSRKTERKLTNNAGLGDSLFTALQEPQIAGTDQHDEPCDLSFFNFHLPNGG